jgi:hypothetical protein
MTRGPHPIFVPTRSSRSEINEPVFMYPQSKGHGVAPFEPSTCNIKKSSNGKISVFTKPCKGVKVLINL